MSLLLFLCMYIAAISSHAIRNERRLFYIYEHFPDILSNPWPSRNLTLSAKSVWKHAFNENEGFGKHYDDTSYFETWQYGSFRVILSRLRRSRYRTYNISEASLFFIPYDIGTESYVDEFGEYRDRGNPNANVAVSLLQEMPLFRRYNGYDHFLVHSSTVVAHKISLKALTFYQNFTNVTVLTVEVLPRAHHFLKHLKYLQPIPMVSMYHWQKSERKKSVPAIKYHNSDRDIFITFFGSANTGGSLSFPF